MPMPIESIYSFKSFHLHLGFIAEKRIRVYYGCNSSVLAHFLQHHCRFDSVSCKSLFCADLSLSLARSVFCHCCAKNIPWPLRKQRESSAYLYFIRLLCMAKQLLWCSRKIEMLKTEEKTGILLSGIQIKSEITLLDMDTLTHKYRPFVRQNGTHNCSNWLLRVFL